MRRFQYDVATNLNEAALELSGKNGWELVSVVYVPRSETVEGFGASYVKMILPAQTRFYFKKEMSPL